jgi:RNA polymerase sigma-70 factor (ECF subfamily)
MSTLPETRASLLVRLPQAADAAAWDEFAQLYAPVVWRLARRRGLQPADADDLVQEVLAAVARSVAGWLDDDGRGRFRAWLLTIARNTTINFLTRAKHRPLASGDSAAAHLLAQLPQPSADGAAELVDLEVRRELFRRAADQVQDEVAPATWQAFWQTAVAGRPIAEVARHLDMSAGSIYIARSRVMVRLRAAAERISGDES